MKLIISFTVVIAIFFLVKGQGALSKTNIEALAMDGPVVAELFTSQSCSSCPPADKVLQTLSENENIIALGCHVTYWNHLSWEDTLSHEFCTARQQAYSREANRSRVFTPELIVNGKDSMVGSRQGDVNLSIKRNLSQIETIAINAKSPQTLLINLPNVNADNSVLNLISYGSFTSQKVLRGENKGKTIGYINPVQNIKVIDANWNGTAQTIEVDISDIDEGASGYAVLAQKGTAGTGEIIAAGQLRL